MFCFSGRVPKRVVMAFGLFNALSLVGSGNLYAGKGDEQVEMADVAF
jgi:hypothetical protein